MSNLTGPDAGCKDDLPSSFGTPQQVFDAVDELAAMAAIHADQIRLFASTGDMTGVEYATRRLWAHMRVLGGVIRDFKDHGHTLGPKG